MKIVVTLFMFGLCLFCSCEDTDLGIGTGSTAVSEKIKGLPKQLQRVVSGLGSLNYTFIYNDSTQQLIQIDVTQNNTKATYSLAYNTNGQLSALHTPVSSIELVYQNQQLIRSKEIRGDSSWVGSYSYAPTGQPTVFRYTRNLATNENSPTTIYSFEYNWQGNNLYQLIQRGTQVAYDEITIETDVLSNTNATLRLFFLLTNRPTARWLSPNLPTTETWFFKGKTLIYEATLSSENKLQSLKIKEDTSKNIVEEETWHYY